MAQDKTVDDLHAEIVEWKKAKESLNREIIAVENSTANIVNWMQDNTINIQHAYFAIQEALYNKSESELEQALDLAGDTVGLVTRMLTSNGKTMFDEALEVFGKDSAVLLKLSLNDVDFPDHLSVTEKDLRDVAKAEEEAAKEKNGESSAEVDEQEQDPKKRWWERQSSIDQKKKESLEAEIKVVRQEIVGLQTSKPFYIDSFFEWVGAVQGLREGVPGEGEYADFLRETYRNPEYVLTQVYNDSNETLQAVYDDIYRKSVAFNAVKASFAHKNITEIMTALMALEEHDDCNDIMAQLLEEESQASFITWALDTFAESGECTEAYRRIVDVLPLELMRGRDIDQEHVDYFFNEVFEHVLAGRVNPNALLYTLGAVDNISENNQIVENTRKNLRQYSDGIFSQVDKGQDWTKDALHTIFTVIGYDSRAIDFYVDMREAISGKKIRNVKSLLNNASSETLEQWLLLRGIFEPTAEHIMEELDFAETSSGRVSLFKSAISAGIPPINLHKSQGSESKIEEMAVSLVNLARLSVSHWEDDAFAIFEGVLNFVEANTTKEEFAKILATPFVSRGAPSLVEIALVKYSIEKYDSGAKVEEEERNKFFRLIFSGVETDVEAADILYTAAQSAQGTENAEALMEMSDKIVGDFIEVDTDQVTTVTNPKKMGQSYYSYGALGYFSGTKRDQSEAEIPEKDVHTYINIIGGRDGTIKIDGQIVRPADWDIICYNEALEEIEFLKSNKERVVFPLDPEKATSVLEIVSSICSHSLNIQDTAILNPYNFETLRYDSDTKELVIDQTIVLPEVTPEDFSAILAEVRSRNSDVLFIEEENLVLNTTSIDAIYRRGLASYGDNEEEKEGEEYEWEQFVADILMNGRSVCIKDLFREKEYSVDSDLEDIQNKEDALVFSILEQLERVDYFERVIEEVTVNKRRVALVRTCDGHSVALVTQSDKYLLEPQEYLDSEWLGYEVLAKSTFIDGENGNYTFRVFDEEVVVNKREFKKRENLSDHVSILKDFLCNLDDICEVSVYKNESRLVIKSGGESVSLEVEEKAIPKIVKKLGLEDTVLGQVAKKGKSSSSRVIAFRKAAAVLGEDQAQRKEVGARKMLDFFSNSSDTGKVGLSVEDSLVRIKAYAEVVDRQLVQHEEAQRFKNSDFFEKIIKKGGFCI